MVPLCKRVWSVFAQVEASPQPEQAPTDFKPDGRTVVYMFGAMLLMGLLLVRALELQVCVLRSSLIEFSVGEIPISCC